MTTPPPDSPAPSVEALVAALAEWAGMSRDAAKLHEEVARYNQAGPYGEKAAACRRQAGYADWLATELPGIMTAARINPVFEAFAKLNPDERKQLVRLLGALVALIDANHARLGGARP